jgi:fimbrial chaperone protein
MAFAFLTRASLSGALLCILAGLTPSLAMNVQPLAVDMVSVGTHARGLIQVVNDGASPLPVEIAFKKVDISPEGKTTETDAGAEFLVFPPQAVVPPGATQNFRIQWAGEPDIKKSRTYMFSVNQLPVQLKSGESGVQMVFNFGVIVSVAPPGAQSALTLVGAEAASENGRRGAAVTVENPSDTYSYFSDAKLVLESGSWRKTISPGELKELIGYGVVLPGKRRRFLVPADVPAGPLKARLDYAPKTAK